MAQKKKLLLVGTGVAIVAGVGYVASRFLLGQELTPIAAAELIPQEVIATSYISTDANNWSQLDKVGIPQNILKDNLEKTQKSIFSKTNITYEQDIQPWLGGAIVSVLPSNLKSNSVEDNTLIILGIKNKLKAYDFLKKIETKEKEKIEKTNYQGIDIYQNTSSPSESFYSAIIDDKLVLASNRLTINKVVDTYQGKPSLADQENAKEVLTQKLNLKNSLAQIYFTDYSQLLQSLTQTQGHLATQNIPLDSVKSLIIGLGTEEKALRVQSIAKFNPDRVSLDNQQQSGKMLAQFPENTIAVINGGGISKIWSDTVTQLQKDANTNNSLNMARTSLQSSTNLDLDKDIFSWMNGEFALGLISTPTNIIPDLGIGLGGALILETSDQNTAKASLLKLETLLKQSPVITSNQKNIQGKTITEWREPQSNLVLSYGWINDRSLMFTFGDSIADTIDNRNGKSLQQSSKFQAISQQLPNNNQGYFYLNLNPVTTAINRLPGDRKRDLTPETIELLNSLEGIAATTVISDKSSSQVDLLVKFR